MSNYILLTGSTGLVGRYLIRDLLLSGHRLALVNRPSKKQNIFERLEEILQKWEGELGTLLPRPVCFEGDVAEPGLGLDSEARQWISRHCDRIIHNAAVLTFHGSDRQSEPWRTNLEGTRNTLQLCKETGLRIVHYVSTAYVSGRRDGVIREDELDCGQEFRNDYEQSKFLAEQLVREADFIDELTVYRPAVIAGDSKTGYTSTYHGLYMYLQLMSVINRNTEPDEHGVRHTNIRFDITGDEPRNIVPVDWVSAVICHIFNTPAAHGKTFHLSPIDPITPKNIIDAGYKYFNSCGVEFTGSQRKFDAGALNPLERQTYHTKTLYEPYEESDPTFDTTNLLAFCGHLPCPPIDESALHKMLKYGEEDRWGRRKLPPPVIPFMVSDLLQSARVDAIPQSSGKESRSKGGQRAERQQVALDIIGPGGGQWQLTLLGEHLVDVVLGLPPESSRVPVLRISSSEFMERIQRKGRSLEHSSSSGISPNALDRQEVIFEKLFTSLAAGTVAATVEK